jgi:hypothetical protein
VRAFPDLLNRYYDAFAAWQTPDATVIVNRIGNALVMLRLAALAIPAAVPEDDPQRVAFRTQIAGLRARLLTVGGEVGVAALAEDVFAEADLFNGVGEQEDEEDEDEEDEYEDDGEIDDDDDEEDFEGDGLHENTDGDLPY